jgi:undecaprenyl pyrophosphate phosphatase UppP
MTIFSVLCYVLFGYLVVSGVILYKNGFHKAVGIEKKVRYTKESMEKFEKPGAVSLILAGVAGLLFTAFSDAELMVPCIVAGVFLVIFLGAYYYIRVKLLRKKK